MTTEMVTDIVKEGLFVILKTSAPPLIVSLVIGLCVSIFQTVTSIQEQTLTFVPKEPTCFQDRGPWSRSMHQGLHTP